MEYDWYAFGLKKEKLNKKNVFEDVIKSLFEKICNLDLKFLAGVEVIKKPHCS
jgi:hypothetical protein